MTHDEQPHKVGDMLTHITCEEPSDIYIITAMRWSRVTLLQVTSGKSSHVSWNTIEWFYDPLKV